MDHQANPVVHVRQDSDTQLESLFDVLNQQPGGPQKTFRERNLPKSFFEQPTRGVHSRESSQDSTSTPFSPAALNQIRLVGQLASHPGLAINHGRSVSSPATLPPISLPVAPPQPQHNKQNSMDFVEETMGQLHIPSGNNWEPVKGGQQRYHFNGSQEQLSWPTKSVSTNAINSNAAPGTTLSPAHSHTSSPSVSVQNLGPLPRGWEQGVTPDGEVYYINHLERTTSWFDPRLPKQLQRPGPIKVGNTAAPPATQQPATTSNPQPAAVLLPQPQQQQQQQPLQVNPPQQQQAQSQQQQVSPPQISPPQQQQQQLPQQSISQQQQQQAVAAAVAQQQQQQQQQQTPSSTPQSKKNPQLIQFELDRLRQEKDRLQRETEEIAKRELLLKEMMSLPRPTPQPAPAPPPTSIQSVSTSGVDPFLGQGSSLEAHARQESGDSGLGGMTSYSLPRTPEDFLGNVDEMDTQDNVKQMLKPQGSDFNMNDLQNNMCMDMGTLGDVDQPGMESEDLVPSLQEISNLSSDLLNDVDVGKMDTLLWL